MGKSSRRERRLLRKKKVVAEKEDIPQVVENKEKFNPFYSVIEKNYKKLLIIPVLMLVVAIALVGIKVATTGDFIDKGVSLKGGVTLSVTTEFEIDTQALQAELQTQFPREDVSVRSFRGATTGFIASAAIDGEDPDILDNFLNSVRTSTGLPLEQDDYSLEIMGASLGQSFFKETFKSLIIAFLFMGTVVFLYFAEQTTPKIVAVLLAMVIGTIVFMSDSTILYIIAAILSGGLIYTFYKYSIPSVAVILAAFSDIVVTVAVFNLFGLQLTSAGIAAFLMLIGYSVDTDILLSVRVLKRTHGSISARIWSAMTTGLTMNITTMAAISVALILSESEVLTQIMTILLIGLVVDVINTWLQNAAILRWYLEK